MSTTDGSGNYTIVGLGEGTYQVQASPPGGASRQQTVSMSGDQTLDFDLPPSGVSGVVVDGGSGQPVQNASVSVAATDGSPGRGARATTDSNGTFSIEGLDPQPSILTVQASDYAVEQKNVTPGADGSDALRVELMPTDGVDVRAVNGAFGGVPIGSLFADVRDPGGNPVVQEPIELANGVGKISSLRPGGYLVRLSPGGGFGAGGGSGCAPVILSITVPSALIPVTFTAGGTLVINAGSMLGVDVRLQNGPFGSQVHVGDAVTQRSNMTPGSYRLTVLPNGTSQNFTVTEGQTTQVTLGQ